MQNFVYFVPRPTFEQPTPTEPPSPSSYHVSYDEEPQQPYQQAASQGYQQQPSNSVAPNPTQQNTGTLFYQRPQEEVEQEQETTDAPEVTPYVATYSSYSKPFTSFAPSSTPPPPAPQAPSAYPSTSAPSFPPQVGFCWHSPKHPSVYNQVEEAFPHLFGGSADSPWESQRYHSYP